ncbi:MAG: phosphoribosylformylglycinamidine synthase subunit PurQ [Nitrospirae bacterium]|nr:phosphoribosylformylglycinamidine synthase subunit PurQ [Nitrospirota bacterium]
MRFGVLVFPGSNCDHDCYHVMKHVMGQEVDFIWHKEESFKVKYDGIIIPGGFSYGDYLRTGALARFSPVMKALEAYAKAGGMVIGICNGFQILLEAGLLPGAMMRNRSLKFVCKDVYLKVESDQTPFTRCMNPGQIMRVPIAHAEGNYFADDETLARMKENRQIIFRYVDRDGNATDDANPNGSRENIAGICNEGRNVLGMMPHPERCAEAMLGNTDGKDVFASMVSHSAIFADSCKMPGYKAVEFKK